MRLFVLTCIVRHVRCLCIAQPSDTSSSVEAALLVDHLPIVEAEILRLSSAIGLRKDLQHTPDMAIPEQRRHERLEDIRAGSARFRIKCQYRSRGIVCLSWHV